MKLMKNVIFKRIVIYLCCTVLFTSCLFMSYQVPVYASESDVTFDDLVEDAFYVALSALGIYAFSQSGGVLTLSVLMPFISNLAGEGFDLHDYIIQDSEAGTTTISADFVNLVLQAYKEYKEENGEKFDGIMNPGADGYYHYDSMTSLKFWKPMDSVNCSVTYTDINTIYPCAVVVYSNVKVSDNNFICRAHLVFYNKVADEFYTIYTLSDNVPPGEIPETSDFAQALEGTLYLNKPYYVEKYLVSGKINSGEFYPFKSLNMSGGLPKEAYIQVTSSSIPVYHSLSALKEGLRTGDFSAAYNYGKPSSDVETPSYTGEYNGGDITVLTSSLDALRDKIVELEKSNKSLEEKLKELLEWLKSGGGSGGGGGGDVTVDIDLSTTNGWLSKIYEKVSQIFDKISGGSAGTGENILQESLDAVLAKLDDLNAMLKKYLSEITGDLDDIKGQLANMSEQEFEEKSDSFLGEVMDAFSEISEVVKTKFPFSIPNDLRIFLSKIAPAPPEAEAALYLNDTSSVSLYSGEHGGGGSSDGEPNPPGGGGASRPGSSFVDVEHGGGGGSREPAEMREAPVFRLPIVIERYGIEEYIIIDMAPFDPLSRFSRSFFTIIFMVCLFNLTFKVIGMWGDIIG
ncbi:MAG: hypothetical protein OSJ59_12615 [Lachnospiraceae bacterium]|nr:hypothetical protein [Lachnospiraceae bacterium]